MKKGDYETIKYRGKGGIGFECSGRNAEKLMEQTFPKALGWIAKATGIATIGAAVLYFARPILKRAGEKVSDFIFNSKSSKQSPDPPMVTGEQIVNHKGPESRWIIPGILREGNTIILYGPERVGKTTLGLNWACSMNAGICDESLPSYTPVKVTALYYNLEMDKDELDEFVGQNPLFKNLKLVNQRVWHSTAELLEHVKRKLAEISGPCVVFIDNLTTCGLGSDANSAREFHLNLMALKDERFKNTGAHTSFVAFTHTLKEATIMRGSGVLSNLANARVQLLPGTKDGQILMNVENVRSAAKPECRFLLERICEPGNHHFKFVKMVDGEDSTSGSSSTDVAKRQNRQYRDIPEEERQPIHEKWKDYRNDGMSYADIASMTVETLHIEVTRQTVYNYFQVENE